MTICDLIHKKAFEYAESYCSLVQAVKERQLQVMVISDNHSQRHAFDEVLRSIGFDVVGCYGSKNLVMLSKLNLPDSMVWLVDDHLSDELQDFVSSLHPRVMLVGFLEAPSANNQEQYKKWQRAMIRQLCQSLSLPKPKKSKPEAVKPWRYVLFLGASMGGPEAVKLFLDNISPNLPIAVLLAHHYDGQMIQGLPKVLTRHNEWKCRVIDTNQSLKSGQCLIAPVDSQIVCGSDGRVILLNKPWEGEYQPNISQLLKNTSDVFGMQLIGIIFSGMGDDGSAFLSEIDQNRSYLWAQSPETSRCSSQPSAMINSGYCQFVGSPIELAQRVNYMLRGLKYA